MKSTLKIHDFEIIIDGVGEQWLKQNHQHIIQAIQEAFQPFDNREFDDSIIDEIEINLPQSQNFNDFLFSLIEQLRSQIVDKFVISSFHQTQQIQSIPVSNNWESIEKLINDLNQAAPNSLKSAEIFDQLLVSVNRNNAVIWKILSKLGLSKELIDAIKTWSKSENLDLKMILIWIVEYIHNQKKNEPFQPDQIFLKTVLFSKFNNNLSQLSISNMNALFIDKLIEFKDSKIQEFISFEKTIESINFLLSNFISDSNLLRNSINSQFIQKIFKLNSLQLSQKQEPQKKEVIFYFNIIKIANSLSIPNLQQLINELNFYYLNATTNFFDLEQIRLIFNKYLPSNKINLVVSLLNLVVQETKLINANQKIESNLLEIFKKIDDYISEHAKTNEFSTDSQSTQINPLIDNTINEKIIFQQLIKFHFFKFWPQEYNSYISLFIQQFLLALQNTNSRTFEFPFLESNNKQQIIVQEFNRIFESVFELKKDNYNEIDVENYIISYGPLLNVLLINLIELEHTERFKDSFKDSLKPNFISDFIDNNSIDLSKEFKKPEQRIFFNKLIDSPFSSLIDDNLLEKLKNKSLTQIFAYLSEKTNRNFAQYTLNLIQFGIQIKNQHQQTEFANLFIQWYFLNFEKLSLSQNTNQQYIKIEEFTKNFQKVKLDHFQKQSKEELLQKTLSQFNKEIEITPELIKTFEFTEEELQLWNSLLSLSNQQEVSQLKRFNQLTSFFNIYRILLEQSLKIQEIKSLTSRNRIDEISSLWSQYFHPFLDQPHFNIQPLLSVFIQQKSQFQLFKISFLQIIANFQLQTFDIENIQHENLELGKIINILNEFGINTGQRENIYSMLQQALNFENFENFDNSKNKSPKDQTDFQTDVQQIADFIQHSEFDNKLFEQIIRLQASTSSVAAHILEELNKIDQIEISEFSGYPDIQNEFKQFKNTLFEIGNLNILLIFFQEFIQNSVNFENKFNQFLEIESKDILSFQKNIRTIISELENRMNQLLEKFIDSPALLEKISTSNLQNFILSNKLVLLTWFNAVPQMKSEKLKQKLKLNLTSLEKIIEKWKAEAALKSENLFNSEDHQTLKEPHISDEILVDETTLRNQTIDLESNELGTENTDLGIESTILSTENTDSGTENGDIHFVDSENPENKSTTNETNEEGINRNEVSELFETELYISSEISKIETAKNQFAAILENIIYSSQLIHLDIATNNVPTKEVVLNASNRIPQQDFSKFTIDQIELIQNSETWINTNNTKHNFQFSLVRFNQFLGPIKDWWQQLVHPFINKKTIENESRTNQIFQMIKEYELQFEELLNADIYVNISQPKIHILNHFMAEFNQSDKKILSLKSVALFINVFETFKLIVQQNIEFENIELKQVEPNDLESLLTFKDSILSFLNNMIHLHKYGIMFFVTEEYTSKSDFEIAKETKIISEILPIIETEIPANNIRNQNIWYQTELKVDADTLFDRNSHWKYFFFEESIPVFIKNEKDQDQTLNDLDKKDRLKLLLNHPNYKKWMVELGRNNAEGFLELSSKLSLTEILSVHQDKFKGFNIPITGIEELVLEITQSIPILSSLSFYQLSKFQLLQTQTPLTSLQLAEIFYNSYLSISSNKTLTEIVEISKKLIEKLELTKFEITLFNQIVNQKLPQQNQTDTETKIVSKTLAEVNTLAKKDIIEIMATHAIRYPNISESEIIDQLNIFFKDSTPRNPIEIKAIIQQISTRIWQETKIQSSILSRSSIHLKFLHIIIKNWIEFKHLHWSIQNGFDSVKNWINENKTIISENIKKEIKQTIHPTWNLIEETSKIKTISQVSNKQKPAISNETFSALSKPFETEAQNQKISNIDSIEISRLKNEIVTEIKQFKNDLEDTVLVSSKKKPIDNQQNKEEFELHIPIKPKNPNIMDWEIFNLSTQSIDQSILSILLVEGLNHEEEIKVEYSLPLGINQFLSSKAIFRILGNSSIPIQFLGLLFDGYFGYSMGILEENWNTFSVPQKSKSLIEKLKKIRQLEKSTPEANHWLNKILDLSEIQPDKILSSANFRLIIEEITKIIVQKLSTKTFGKTHHSLQEKWISHLIFFKIIQYKDSENEIGGYFSILASEPEKIDYWIHKISDYILFDIEVEYDFWLKQLPQLGNYLSETNVITIFQLSESIKIINPESKLELENVIENVLQTIQNRNIEEAIFFNLIPRLLPLFYSNQLSKTTQFRELKLLSLILTERQNIGLTESYGEEKIVFHELFKQFSDAENLEIDAEILNEVSPIIGNNLDETARWILNELNLTSVVHLQRFTSIIQEQYQDTTKIPNIINALIENPEMAAAIQEIILPMSVNLKDKPKVDPKIKREIESGTKFITGLCGLIMLSPFLSTLFRRMGLLEKNEFISEYEQLKAYKALMTIPTLDEEESFEHQDLIPRIITGIAPEDNINFVPELTEDEVIELRNFIEAVMSQWPVMANATLRGFIESFLLRDGKAWKEGQLWKIEVNGHGADIILQTLTWGFATMKFPWTPYMIETDWKAP